MRGDARSVQLCVSTIVLGSYHMEELTPTPPTVQLSVLRTMQYGSISSHQYVQV